MAMFMNNNGMNGGATYFDDNSNMVFMKKSSVLFKGNVAEESGRAVFSTKSCMELTENSKMIFTYNTAEKHGGGVALFNEDNVAVEGNSVVLFFLKIQHTMVEV